jgi:D-glycero-alpha-D-manno-heptose 1-phosphate guanylyltransferase
MYEAIILAGGLGTRLREAVPDLPKPMAPIAGRPFLAWQMDYLIRLGVTRFILSVGYKADTIRDHFGDVYNNAVITYVEETQPLGTGGAIKFALQQATHERVFVFNGDTLCEVNLNDLRQLTSDHDESLGILVKHVNNAGRYGAIDFHSESKLVTTFGEKSSAVAGYINAGIYDVPRNLFENLSLDGNFSFETNVIPQMVGEQLYALQAGSFFIDIGIESDFVHAQSVIPSFVSQ